ncbi:nucleolin-like [Acanthochromis polyacanthus]|uniref:nucleolin-like n=1 Tax=Acanthochromis polyacanthus TaxID=80966 RepID=UPI00223436D9|nr:nucleolin-like [Acanthochromis polyacanthus]
MCTMLAACFSAARGDGPDRQRRALQDQVVNPRHWHSVEPRQMADNSSEYLDDSTDEDEEDDEYEESDDELGDYLDEEQLDDPNNTTADMTDTQMNSTTVTEAEETMNTSMPVKPRLGRGLADMEMSGDMEEDNTEGDSFSSLEPGLGMGMEMEDMKSSDDPEDMEEDEDDYSEDDTFPPFEPRLVRGMNDMEASDDPEDMEDDISSEEEDYADSDEDDSDSEDESDDGSSTTAKMTEYQMNTTAVDAHVAPTALNTSMPLEPRLGRGMEDMEMSGDPENMEEDDSGDYDMSGAEMNALSFEPRLLRGMDDLLASDDPEDMEEDEDDSEDDYDSEDETSSPLLPRLVRGMEEHEDYDYSQYDDASPLLVPRSVRGIDDDDASGDEDYNDYSGDDKMSDGSGEVSDD